MSEQVVKNIVVIGDGATGKTCLLHSYTEGGEFNTAYIPTIYDKDVIELVLDNQNYTIKLHDTAGQEEFEMLRKLAYKDADAFIICYSIDQRSSYENIIEKWAPELKQTNEYTPTILVATKCDLRDSPPNNVKLIETAEGDILKNKIKAITFLECSAKEYKNINEVIYEAVRATNIDLTQEPTPNIFTRFCKCFSC